MIQRVNSFYNFCKNHPYISNGVGVVALTLAIVAIYHRYITQKTPLWEITNLSSDTWKKTKVLFCFVSTTGPIENWMFFLVENNVNPKEKITIFQEDLLKKIENNKKDLLSDFTLNAFNIYALSIQPNQASQPEKQVELKAESSSHTGENYCTIAKVNATVGNKILYGILVKKIDLVNLPTHLYA